MQLTSNPILLNWIKGYKIPFSSRPLQKRLPVKLSVSKKQNKLLESAINDLILKGAVVERTGQPGNQFLSNFFLADKSNGGKRFILNLKPLNKFVIAPHFKMENYKTVASLMSKNCFLTTIDLKDAYFLISVRSSDRKFLRFSFENKIFEFTCIPFGLSSAPYTFTKLMKPVLEFLRREGVTCVNYLDDFLIIGDSQEICFRHTQLTLKLLRSLGFIINESKSCLIPSKTCKFLGFIFDSEKMRMELPLKKKQKIKTLVSALLTRRSCKIVKFAQLIGNLVAACPAIKYGWMYTKSLEREKNLALLRTKTYCGNMRIRSHLLHDLRWWYHNINKSFNDIKKDSFALEIFTDASLTGWGACALGERAHGWWSEEEGTHHINYLELTAIFYGIKCFARPYANCNILVRSDNTTAISYINKMGSVRQPKLNLLARKIWKWCQNRNIWLFASYINSKENWQADKESRSIQSNTEWSLNPIAFDKIVKHLGKPIVDLFASKNNFKCPKYVSWLRDPGSFAVDAFTIPWEDGFYAFPPFSQILRTVQKIKVDKVEGILLVPFWPSQPWYPLVLKLALEEKVILEPDLNLLSCPYRETHPLASELTLVAYKVSGKPSA